MPHDRAVHPASPVGRALRKFELDVFSQSIRVPAHAGLSDAQSLCRSKNS